MNLVRFAASNERVFFNIHKHRSNIERSPTFWKIAEGDLFTPTGVVESKSIAGSIKEGQAFDNRANLKIMISDVAMHLPDVVRRDLFEQIDRLLDWANWSEDDSLITPTSFRTFLRFIIYHGPLRRPALTVGIAETLVSTWLANGDRLTIEFLPLDRVRVVAYRSAGAGGEPEVLSYLGRVEGAIVVIQHNNLEHWYRDGAP